MSEPNTENRTILERVQAVATIFSIVAVPVIVAVLGANIQKALKLSEARTKSMELAIAILKEPPGRNEQPGLRVWAIETLQASSDIQLSEAARRELLAKPLLSVQPMQRNVESGTSGFFDIGKAFEIGNHKAKVQSIEEDYVVLSIDGSNKTIAINDSVVVPPENCVIHLLGIGFTNALIEPGKKDRTLKRDSTFMAFVCPEH